MERGENRQLEYLQVNPLGSVPAMTLEDGTVLREASALLTYVDGRQPAAFHCPSRDAFGQAKLAEFLSFFTTELHAAFAPHFAPGRFLADPEYHDELRQTAYERLLRLLDLTDDLMVGSFVFGDHRSVADPYLYVITRWIQGTPLELANFPLLAAFKRRMDTDPAVMQVLSLYDDLQKGNRASVSK